MWEIAIDFPLMMVSYWIRAQMCVSFEVIVERKAGEVGGREGNQSMRVNKEDGCWWLEAKFIGRRVRRCRSSDCK